MKKTPWPCDHAGLRGAIRAHHGRVNTGLARGIGRADGEPVEEVHAAACDARSPASGSGSISSRDTAPPVKSRTAFISPTGTPFVFHCEMAAGVRPR